VSVRIGIFGHGRLGGLVAEAADDLELVWALGRDGTPDPDIDVALDLSNADAAPDHLAWCAATGTDLVIGATGWDGPH
jgi:dihydrodipicolinate reductase